MTELPRIISVDDHIVEPPGLWQDRLPARFRDRAPRVERHYGFLDWEAGGKVQFHDDPDRSSPRARWCDHWVYDDPRRNRPGWATADRRRPSGRTTVLGVRSGRGRHGTAPCRRPPSRENRSGVRPVAPGPGSGPATDPATNRGARQCDRPQK